MTTAAPTAVVLTVSIFGMACVTLSGCGQPPPPAPTGPPSVQEAWNNHRDAFERRSISDLVTGYPPSSDQSCVTQFMVETFDPNLPFFASCGGQSGNVQSCYGDLLQGMAGPPSIIDFRLDQTSSDPHVVFVWNGPGIDIATEMIAWDERNLVKWHQAYIKKSAEYGLKLGVKARAASVHVARQDSPDFPWTTMDQSWYDRDLDVVMMRFTDESKLFAFYGDTVMQEFSDLSTIRVFFQQNTNDLPSWSLDTYIPRTVDGVPGSGSIMTGLRYDLSTGARLNTLVYSPDQSTIKLQLVAAFNLTTLASYVV